MPLLRGVIEISKTWPHCLLSLAALNQIRDPERFTMNTISVICLCASIILAGIIASLGTRKIDHRLKELDDRLDHRLKEISDRLDDRLKEIGGRLNGILEELRKLQNRGS